MACRPESTFCGAHQTIQEHDKSLCIHADLLAQLRGEFDALCLEVEALSMGHESHAVQLQVERERETAFQTKTLWQRTKWLLAGK